MQFGGQTPLNLSLPLKAAGVTIIGTSPESIDLAEDRKRFGKLAGTNSISRRRRAQWRHRVEEAVKAATRLDIRCLCRPSYVLGGRAMVIAYDDDTVTRYMKEAVEYSQDRPVLIDQVSRRRHRSRCRRAVGRRGRRHWRHHAAHRRGWYSLGRFVVRVAGSRHLPQKCSTRCATTRSAGACARK